jgi:hypothetical protein
MYFVKVTLRIGGHAYLNMDRITDLLRVGDNTIATLGSEPCFETIVETPEEILASPPVLRSEPAL